MKKSIVYLSIFIVSISSCNYSSHKKQETVIYRKDGLSFNLPKYWKVKKDRPIDGIPDSRFISISDEEPFSKDSYLIITAIDSVSVEKTMQNLIAQSRTSYNKRKIEFGMLNEPKEIVIGRQNALRADFETRVINNRNKGSFTLFNLNGKTFSFISSVNVKDKKENCSVVDSVIKSLHLK
ncbi:hypothetical protein [Pedobacter agri]|uniref:hypothetical protein n=1 Tax=Pedobacter agri TaxID=454586 RepID=UPI002930FF5C|nr:hypothetical protein [Pedobacter agri]